MPLTCVPCPTTSNHDGVCAAQALVLRAQNELPLRRPPKSLWL